MSRRTKLQKNFKFMLAEEAEFDADSLRQGDILVRDDRLSDAIREAHQYYADAVGYNYFLVLTPSCELIRRNGKCSARYITLAAVRPLEIVIEREIKKYNQSVKAPGKFLVREKRILAERFVERLLHNDEEGYLFLPSEFFPDRTDRCGFLLLSIALRSTHYNSCLNSKFIQLSDIFAAQVGHLTSGLYGQIATPALEEQTDINFHEVRSAYFDRYINSDGMYWLSKEQIRILKSCVSSFKDSHPGVELTDEIVSELARSLPSDMKIVSNALRTIVENIGIAHEDGLSRVVDVDRLVNAFESDVGIRRAVPS